MPGKAEIAEIDHNMLRTHEDHISSPREFLEKALGQTNLGPLGQNLDSRLVKRLNLMMASVQDVDQLGAWVRDRPNTQKLDRGA